MSPQSWADFDIDTALERDMLSRSLPLAPTSGFDYATILIRPPLRNVAVHLRSGDTLGATPASCVELLSIRPLLVGTAWKVLDLFLETALNVSGHTPSHGNQWRIIEKRNQARAHARTITPAGIPKPVWDALVATYARTIDLRHCLVHRKAWTDSVGALVGNDAQGMILRPLSPSEQEALGRAVLRAAETTTSTADARVVADLTRQLGSLSGLHQVRLPASLSADQVPTAAVILEPLRNSSDLYRLPIPTVRKRTKESFPFATYIDLLVRFSDRPGFELRGRLEEPPHRVIPLNPLQPPPWLH